MNNDDIDQLKEISENTGYITADDILKTTTNPESMIGEIEQMLDMGIDLVDDKPSKKEKISIPKSKEGDDFSSKDFDIDDSVKMYLREIGTINLLKNLSYCHFQGAWLNLPKKSNIIKIPQYQQSIYSLRIPFVCAYQLKRIKKSFPYFLRI